MEKKAVFFDADGTICDMEKGVPSSAKKAVEKLIENGHEAWLCTGRSRAFVAPYLEEIPFTGMISVCSATIELIPKGCSKAAWIAAVLQICKIPWKNSVVFGDSNNDLSMFEYAATKVAMGNASPKIKALADYVTTDMFHYGIKNGLEYLGLI